MPGARLFSASADAGHFRQPPFSRRFRHYFRYFRFDIFSFRLSFSLFSLFITLPIIFIFFHYAICCFSLSCCHAAAMPAADGATIFSFAISPLLLRCRQLSYASRYAIFDYFHAQPITPFSAAADDFL